MVMLGRKGELYVMRIGDEIVFLSENEFKQLGYSILDMLPNDAITDDVEGIEAAVEKKLH